MPKEEYKLEFTVADENDEIYKDKKIYAVTMTNPNPPPKIVEGDTDTAYEVEMFEKRKAEAIKNGSYRGE